MQFAVKKGRSCGETEFVGDIACFTGVRIPSPAPNILLDKSRLVDYFGFLKIFPYHIHKQTTSKSLHASSMSKLRATHCVLDVFSRAFFPKGKFTILQFQNDKKFIKKTVFFEHYTLGDFEKCIILRMDNCA